jgi:hypothetical protein
MSGPPPQNLSRRAFPAGGAPRGSGDTGDCGSIRDRTFHGSPSHAPRGSPIEVMKLASARTAAGRPAG